MPATATAAAAEMLPLPEYQQQRQPIFPSVDSLRWFIRQHHAELVEHRALLMPAGKKLIAPDAFDRVVVEVGARLAAGRKRGTISGGGAA
jgi:hypothetical protein